jgi:O-antigen ligase
MLGGLLTFIFIRPFISSLAFPFLNFLYSALFLIFLIIWIIYKGISIKEIQHLKYPLILFSLALIISAILAPNKLNSIKELFRYITALFLLLIAASLTYKDKIRVIHAIILSGLIISLLALYQYFFGFKQMLEYLARHNLSSPAAIDYIQRKRIFLPFVTPNTLAGYLAMIIPLTLINKNKFWLIIPLSFTLLLTKSLGAFLSIFLAGGIYFYLRAKLKKRGMVILSGVVILLGILVIIGLVFVTRTITLKEHLQPLFSTLMRIYYWKGAISIIKARPLMGIGLGGLKNLSLMDSRYTHNSYLQIWAEMGLLGIAAWLWIIFTSFNIGFKKLKKNGNQQNSITLSLILVSFVFLIHNVIDFTFFLPEISFIWWIILGAMASVSF